ncbi:MAG: hypothetical protein ACP5D7_07460 [Limnospira sp.]
MAQITLNVFRAEAVRDRIQISGSYTVTLSATETKNWLRVTPRLRLNIAPSAWDIIFDRLSPIPIYKKLNFLEYKFDDICARDSGEISREFDFTIPVVSLSKVFYLEPEEVERLSQFNRIRLDATVSLSPDWTVGDCVKCYQTPVFRVA